MKKFLSTILAVVMILSSMAMVASAEETLADGIYVDGAVQQSFSAAQTAAANSENKTITISGTVYFDTRYGISVDGIKVVGINDARIEASTSFGAEGVNETNKKALLSVEAENVEISNITFDGSTFGITLNPNNIFAFNDFNVLRVNSGKTTLRNVTITGSPITLLSIGTANYSATVDAYNLTCEADVKNILGITAYADINAVNGTFNLYSGNVNGFICEDHETGLGTVNADVDGYYSFNYAKSSGNYAIVTTPEWIVKSYNEGGLSQMAKDEYAELIAGSDTETTAMINDIIANLATKRAVAEDLLDMVDDMLAQKYFWGSYVVTGESRACLETYSNTLDAALNPAA